MYKTHLSKTISSEDYHDVIRDLSKVTRQTTKNIVIMWKIIGSGSLNIKRTKGKSPLRVLYHICMIRVVVEVTSVFRVVFCLYASGVALSVVLSSASARSDA